MLSSGGGILSSSKSTSGLALGENVIVGGLVVQLIGFSVFVIVASIFHVRMLRQPTPQSSGAEVPWQRFMYILYAVSALILVRSIFRTVEYAQGFGGSLQQSETWLYVFDASLIFICTILLNIWHPSQIISNGRRKLLSSATEEGFAMEQTSYENSR